MPHVRLNLVLAGAHRGRNITLDGRRFINGKYPVTGDPLKMAPFLAKMGTYYNAFPEGSAELRAAEERYREAWEVKHGKRNAPPKAESRPSAAAQPPLGSDGPEPRSEAGGGGVGGSQREAGADRRPPVSEGGGSGSPDPLGAAILSLDPLDDANWTQGGLPQLSALEAKLGRPVARKAVEAAMPGFTRDAAYKMAE